MFNFYCIYDLKALKPVNDILQILPSDGVAARVFEDVLNTADPNSDFARHPTDFVMVRVGIINFDTLAVDSYGVGASEPVITGASVVRRRRTVDTALSESPAVPMSVANDASSGERKLSFSDPHDASIVGLRASEVLNSH